MAHRHSPSQDPAEGARDIVDHELERNERTEPKHDPRKSHPEKSKPHLETDTPGPDQRIAIPTPIEPGDQNAQTTLP